MKKWDFSPQIPIHGQRKVRFFSPSLNPISLWSLMKFFHTDGKSKLPFGDIFPHSEHKQNPFLIFSFPKSPLPLSKAWLRKGEAFPKGKSLHFTSIPSPAPVPPSPDPACVRSSLEKEPFHSLSVPAMARRVFLQIKEFMELLLIP